MTTQNNKKYDTYFKIFLGGKILYGLFELSAGIFLLLVNKTSIDLIFISLTKGELTEEPNDFFANYLLQLGNGITHSTQIIIGIYLLVYGMIKLFLVIEMLKNRIRVYPYAIGIFLVGLVYQLYKLIISFSPILLVFFLFESTALALIWQHYIRLKRDINKID